MLSQTLTERDWEILKTVARLRLVTAKQIERLHFWDLKESSRPVVRRRVLKRLSDAHGLIALPRRIGGNGRGSEQSMFALDSAGAQLLEQHFNWKNPKPGRLSVPGALFHRHRITVTELYVRLEEKARTGGENLLMGDYQTEPECWWPYSHAAESSHRNNRADNFIKPDAYLLAGLPGAEYEQFWIEVDLGTESTERVRQKIELYATLDRDNAAKPHRRMPKIIVTTTTQRRRDTIRKAVHETEWTVGTWDGDEGIPLDRAIEIRIECFDDAVTAITEELPQPAQT